MLSSMRGFVFSTLVVSASSWAQMLFIVFHTLIEKHGIGDTLFPPQPHSNGTFNYPNRFYKALVPNAQSHPIPKHGSTLLLQLLVDAMKI
ncbi:Fungalysin/Thermolysin Extracellular metalloproteinase 5 [Tulasnella sp. 425]|nr:Fungalysin/Thermolysin Extracellular metalloproteinase 5 [Tulasnella sp. 425]